jgi:tRNA pseudouridine38-40 synthase
VLIITRFHTFFHHIDHYRSDFFLWVTSSGISAARQALAKGEVAAGRAEAAVGLDSDDEEGGVEEG